MRIYYAMEALGLRHHVRSALGVDAGAWNQVSHRVLHWRRELQDRYGIPIERELRACGLATGAGESPPACNCAGHPTPTPRQGAKVLAGGLRLIEDLAVDTGGVSVVNVCLPKDEIPSYRQVSLDRLFNRVNATAAQAGGHALLIFGHGPEETVTRLYHRLRNYNPVPSGPRAGSGGPHTRNLPIERVIGGPLFRDAKADCLLQVAGLVAHALLWQEEFPAEGMDETNLCAAFGVLDRALNRRASRRDPQGVVRR